MTKRVAFPTRNTNLCNDRHPSENPAWSALQRQAHGRLSPSTTPSASLSFYNPPLQRIIFDIVSIERATMMRCDWKQSSPATSSLLTTAENGLCLDRRRQSVSQRTVTKLVSLRTCPSLSIVLSPSLLLHCRCTCSTCCTFVDRPCLVFCLRCAVSQKSKDFTQTARSTSFALSRELQEGSCRSVMPYASSDGAPDPCSAYPR